MGYILDTWNWEDGSAGKRFFFFFSFFWASMMGMAARAVIPALRRRGRDRKLQV